MPRGGFATRTHTGRVTSATDDWQLRVETALLAGNADALVGLYAEAQALFGDDAGSRWASTVSAFDGTAVTG
jgi:hypothetical protein